MALLEGRGAKYHAEHIVGNMYKAEQELATFYKKCDPTNSFNPGIEKMNRSKHYSATLNLDKLCISRLWIWSWSWTKNR